MGITISSDDSIYITGRTYGDLGGQTNSGIKNTEDHSRMDAFITKFTSNGDELWTRLLSSDEISDYGTDAATIKCDFMIETKITQSGEWLSTETDWMKIWDMFGDGLELPLENSLLSKLDSGEVFLAGYVRRGKVYLRGDELGVNGKLIEVINNEITIYDGMCDVSFG